MRVVRGRSTNPTRPHRIVLQSDCFRSKSMRLKRKHRPARRTNALSACWLSRLTFTPSPIFLVAPTTHPTRRDWPTARTRHLHLDGRFHDRIFRLTIRRTEWAIKCGSKSAPKTRTIALLVSVTPNPAAATQMLMRLFGGFRIARSIRVVISLVIVFATHAFFSTPVHS